MPAFTDFYQPWFCEHGFDLGRNAVRNIGSAVATQWNERIPFKLACLEDSTDLTPGFTTSCTLSCSIQSEHGLNSYGPSGAQFTQNKWTAAAFGATGTYYGAGQRNLSGFTVRSYGMGDAACMNFQHYYWGGPISGDEGTGFTHFNTLKQGENYLAIATITNSNSGTGTLRRSGANTTTTQIIAGNKDPQTVTVASTTGILVGDWVVVEQKEADGYCILEEVEVTAVGSGTITGIFRNNHQSGVAVKPALLLETTGRGFWGQQRVLVNRSGTTYSTGRIGSHTGGGLNGIEGASWSVGMVGGDSLNVGVIEVVNDRFTGEFYNGADTPTNTSGPLKSWHQILTTGLTATQLGIMTSSVNGDGQYKGRGNWPSNYTIKPGARVLRRDLPQIICEYSNHTWNVGDVVECAICPYPDVSGFQYALIHYTPNIYCRQFMDVCNKGAQTFQVGFRLRGEMTPGGSTAAWGTGMYIDSAKIGLDVWWGGLANADAICGIRLPEATHSLGQSDAMSMIKFGVGGAIRSSYRTTGGMTLGGGDLSGAMDDVGGGQLTLRAGNNLTNAEFGITWAGHPTHRATMHYAGGICAKLFVEIENNSFPNTSAEAPVNAARLFTDNGGAGGKMRLMVQFPGGGAAQVVATQP